MSTESTRLTVLIDEVLNAQALWVGEPHCCPYLDNRESRSQGFIAERLEPDIYRVLLDRNFRRSGSFFYRAACESCTACVQLRVPVGRFRWTRSLRRVWRKDADLEVSIGAPEATDEKWDLYRSYLEHRHDETISQDQFTFADFLYRSPVDTLEICYRSGGRLLAVSIADVFRDALSSVYVFFDPDDSKRSLGTYSALWEIEYCRAQKLDYYYLGYWVAGSKTMAYKARFGEHQVLDTQYCWCGSSTTTGTPFPVRR